MILPCRNPVHLYRSLLREARYLFDPVSQNFHYDCIRWAFRRQRVKQSPSIIGHPQDDLAVRVTKHDSQQLKRARQYLHMLQRANQGYMIPIKNVLKLAYARKGKQRREMVQNITTMTCPDDTIGRASATRYTKDWRPPEKFSSLLSKQTRVQPHLEIGKKKIQGFPKIPEKNRWHRPFPKSRVKGILQKWYAKHAGLLMPPLQEAPWLKVLAIVRETSEQDQFKAPERRRVGTVGVLTEADEHSSWTDKIDAMIMTSAQKPPQIQRVRASMGNPHRMTSRFLRRMTREAVLQNTPTIVADTSTGKLATRWESGMRSVAMPILCSESQKVSLFD